MKIGGMTAPVVPAKPLPWWTARVVNPEFADVFIFI
jgi:hypothetical protein